MGWAWSHAATDWEQAFGRLVMVMCSEHPNVFQRSHKKEAISKQNLKTATLISEHVTTNAWIWSRLEQSRDTSMRPSPRIKGTSVPCVKSAHCMHTRP
jgi:hypothetical protein